MKKTTIFFDMDNTLIDRLQAAQTAYRMIIEETFPNEGDTFKKQAFEKIWLWDGNGAIPKWEVFGSFQKEYQLEYTWIDFQVERWKQDFSKQTITFPQAESTLKKLKPYYKLGLITNGNYFLQGEKLKRSGLAYLFDMALIAGEINIQKPDKRIFMEACKRIQCQPEEAYFVGDNIKNDIQGSQAVGMTPIYIWRDDSIPCAGVPHIYQIEELLTVIPWE